MPLEGAIERGLGLVPYAGSDGRESVVGVPEKLRGDLQSPAGEVLDRRLT
jgi:hypothetical protein